MTDFAPISLLPSNPYLIVVNKDLPVNNLREFLAYLKANPTRSTWAIPASAPARICSRILLQNVAGSRMNYIPYRGAAPAMIDLLAGQIDLMVDQVQNSMVHVTGGLHQGAGDRVARALELQVGDVPTVDEAGAPGLHMSLWYGFWAPAGTPAPIVAKLHAAVQDALGRSGRCASA